MRFRLFTIAAAARASVSSTLLGDDDNWWPRGRDGNSNCLSHNVLRRWVTLTSAVANANVGVFESLSAGRAVMAVSVLTAVQAPAGVVRVRITELCELRRHDGGNRCARGIRLGWRRAIDWFGCVIRLFAANAIERVGTSTEMTRL